MKTLLAFLFLFISFATQSQDCPPGQIKAPNGNNHWKCESNIPLPVTLTEFRAYEAHLTWVTVTETNVSHFILESSSDAKTWQKQAEVEAKGPGRYTVQVRPALYYRLREIDLDETNHIYLIDNRTLRREGTFQQKNYDTIGREVR